MSNRIIIADSGAAMKDFRIVILQAEKHLESIELYSGKVVECLESLKIVLI